MRTPSAALLAVAGLVGLLAGVQGRPEGRNPASVPKLGSDARGFFDRFHGADWLVQNGLRLKNQATSAPSTVQVRTPKAGTLVGNVVATAGQDQFFGIRYAKAPTAAQRFNAPQAADAVSPDTVVPAQVPGKACFQLSGTDPAYFSDDCLFLNVYRPSGTKSNSRLPVMVWIHGGSWVAGASTSPMYNATNLVKRASNLGAPMIYVSFNYRLGIFGFLGGPDMDQQDASGTAKLNAGYWDQRLALQWVRDNIAAFGGDPRKVTLAGESAGGNSVAAQMLANGGNIEGLFRAAILQSGNQALIGRYNATTGAPLQIWQALLGATGCPNLDCLRNVPAAALAQVNDALIQGGATTAPTLDRYFVAQLPSVQFASGRFPRIPILTGNNLDEGTFFATPIQPITDDATFAGALGSFLTNADNATLAALLQLYPDDPTLGSPFRADLVGAAQDDRFYGAKSMYKRGSALLGDVLFHLGRRQQLLATAPTGVPCYSYLLSQPVLNTTQPLAIYHGTELKLVYDMPDLVRTSSGVSTLDAALSKYASSSALQQTADRMSAFWISFATRLDPNALPNVPGTVPMPRWDPIGRRMIRFGPSGGNDIIRDDFRSTQVNYMLANAAKFAA